MTSSRLHAIVLGLLLAATGLPAGAVCLAPGTTESGYRVPLDEEVSGAGWIVVARVVTRTDKPNPRDKEAPGTSVYLVEVERALKGTPPRRFRFETPNDSGGYRATPGETHLLFIRPDPRPTIDACGNSTALPAASVEATVAALASRKPGD